MATERKEQVKRVEVWNKAHPSGTEVILTDDFGLEHRTRTRGAAWLLGGHTAVVRVDGRTGGYLLDRIRPLESEVKEVTLLLCDLCLNGGGGICWTPGCDMISRTGPDIELRSAVERNTTHACDCGDSGSFYDQDGPGGPDEDCEDCHGTGRRNAIEYWRTRHEREHERAEAFRLERDDALEVMRQAYEHGKRGRFNEAHDLLAVQFDLGIIPTTSAFICYECKGPVANLLGVPCPTCGADPSISGRRPGDPRRLPTRDGGGQ